MLPQTNLPNLTINPSSNPTEITIHYLQIKKNPSLEINPTSKIDPSTKTPIPSSINHLLTTDKENHSTLTGSQTKNLIIKEIKEIKDNQEIKDHKEIKGNKDIKDNKEISNINKNNSKISNNSKKISPIPNQKKFKRLNKRKKFKKLNTIESSSEILFLTLMKVI